MENIYSIAKKKWRIYIPSSVILVSEWISPQLLLQDATETKKARDQMDM